MKNSKFKIGIWLGILTFAFSILHSGAEITATVYPGYQFSANERPTTGNLNLLGRPTILVSGTLGGTNVALAANSVTTTMMSDTLPGTNLLWDGSSPRKLVIKDSGVDTNQISTNIAGLGLGGGGGAALSNKTDNAFLIITNDVLTISLSAFTNLISAVSSNIAGYFVNNYTATNPAVQAQVNFAGASGTIKGSSVNVSNVNRTAEGHYTVSWTNALANTNYLVLLGSYKTSGQDESWVFVTSKTTTNLTLLCTDESPNDHDLHEIYVQIP